MLMLTHTCLLQKIMDVSKVQNSDPDIYIYNIAPDLLTIHPEITASQTHFIKRFIEAPPDHQRIAYVMFHLLVDDLAHYGKISLQCREGFEPHSSGYTYVKGRRLIGSIMDLYRILDRNISYNDAAYRSHLIIEMIYDLVIMSHIRSSGSMALLEDAVHFTRDHREDEFCDNISWLYGIEKGYVRDVLKSAVSYLTKERMERFMNIEGRICFFTNRFGLQNDNEVFAKAISTLFQDAMSSIDNEDFLQETVSTINTFGWIPTV
jgi:hypothetical protein